MRECGHALAGDGVVLHDKGTVVCMGLYYQRKLVAFPVNKTQRGLNFRPARSLISTAPGAAL